MSFASLFIPACTHFQLAVYSLYIPNGMYSEATDVIMSSCRNLSALAFVCEQKNESSSHIQGWTGTDSWSVCEALGFEGFTALV
jgi:hypothetical protein